MELALELKEFKENISAYGGRRELRLELPVEAEVLIPDYQPAVFKIVKCMMEPAILQNNVEGTRWRGEGYLRCTVYYQSDEAGTRIYRTEQKFPFEKTAELPAAEYVPGPAQLHGETVYCNCRAISEHRIDLRGAYALRVETCATEKVELLTALADCGIQQRREKLETDTLVANEEKIITTESKLSMPGAGESILEIGGCYLPQEQTVRAGEVACAGSLRIQVCYCLTGSDEIITQQKEIPAEQILRIEAAAPGDRCCVWGSVLGCTLQSDENETAETTLSVTWCLHTEIWRAQQLMAVADAYSTACQTEQTQSRFNLLKVEEEIAQTIATAVEDELPEPDATVCGCFVRDTALELQQGEKGLCLAGKGVAHILCADARGELTCYDKVFHWEVPGEWQGNAEQCLLHAATAVQKISSRKMDGSVRVEMELAVKGLLLRAIPYKALTEVTVGEMLPEKADGPALYLYFAEQGERIFDIAKRYHARAGDLLAANHLEPEAEADAQLLTPEATCLLIPSAL